MDLTVDHAGQDVKPVRLEDLTGLCCIERADAGDTPAAYCNVHDGYAARRRNVSAFEDEIECGRHGQLQEVWRCLDPWGGISKLPRATAGIRKAAFSGRPSVHHPRLCRRLFLETCSREERRKPLPPVRSGIQFVLIHIPHQGALG